jgi:hypothetical protein
VLGADLIDKRTSGGNCRVLIDAMWCIVDW